jgi:hypothetical protein
MSQQRLPREFRMVAVRPSPSAARDLLAELRRKQQAVTAVLDGKLSLLEAAGRFRDENASSDGETLCRTVIGWVHLALSERPEKAEAVSLRLEGELQSYLDRSGRGRLLPIP